MSNLRKIRKEKNCTQKTLAEWVGVPQQNVSAWENGKQQLPIKHAKVIAKELGCNWKDLYED